MSERDRKHYANVKADPILYQQYLARKRAEAKARQQSRGYETERKRKWRQSNPEKAQNIRRAGHAVEAALQRGRLRKPSTCECCGMKRKLEAHHHRGYERENWLNVEWLCNPCHAARHKQLH